MEALFELIAQNAHLAHWLIFGALILAGLNVPFSADIMILISALLAATVVPENTVHLFLSVLLGCYFSAMVAYWFGRIVGPKLAKVRFFTKLLAPERIEKVRRFYDAHGLLTLILGRFIPFGVRNCIFMSTGMCKMPFGKFILRDAIAVSIWCSTLFLLFFSVGSNYQLLIEYLKKANLFVFLAFSVTVIGFIWYKRRKKGCSRNRREPS